MYAVIKTGGKQYRVQPGDVLVVEKLEGDIGAEVSFDQVLMMGGDAGVTLGAPTVEGALVRATLVETRRGEKIKVFKKIRRQGYRRTNGHRQPESVLRVTALEGGGQSAKWEGAVDLTPRLELVARARGLSPRDGGFAPGATEVEPFFEPAGAELDDVETAALAQELAEAPAAKKARAKAAPKAEVEAAAEAAPEAAEVAADEPAAKKPAARKKAAPKTESSDPAE